MKDNASYEKAANLIIDLMEQYKLTSEEPINPQKFRGSIIDIIKLCVEEKKEEK